MLGSFIVDLRINETLQIGAVGNSAYQVRGESVSLFFEFTIVFRFLTDFGTTQIRRRGILPRRSHDREIRLREN